jgi:hypothetical protein
MLKKLLPKSPWGIALTAAAVILYASPEARRAVRKVAVKGLSTLMALTEQLKESASSVRDGLTETVEEVKAENLKSERLETHHSITYNTDIEPENFLKGTEPLNVMNDDYLKKQAGEIPSTLH